MQAMKTVTLDAHSERSQMAVISEQGEILIEPQVETTPEELRRVVSGIPGPKRVILEIDRYRDRPIPKYFRGDAAFALPGLFETLEAEEYLYAMRIKSNSVLEGKTEHLMRRPVGRPSRKPKVFYHSFEYQAGTWERPRRVVGNVEWHMDLLFPKVGFIVTKLRWRSKSVVKFYNKRGTAEQWIKEGKQSRHGRHTTYSSNLSNRRHGLNLPPQVRRFLATGFRSFLSEERCRLSRQLRPQPQEKKTAPSE